MTGRQAQGVTHISRYLANIEEWNTFVRIASKSCPGVLTDSLLLLLFLDSCSYKRCFLLCGGPTVDQPKMGERMKEIQGRKMKYYET